MDELDSKILRELSKDGRVPVKVLAERLGVPRTTVALRMRKLVDSGVVKGFYAEIDYKKLNYTITSFVLIQVRRGRPIEGKSNQEVLAENLVKELSKRDGLPWIEEAHIVTGDFDLLLKVRARSMEELTKFLITELAKYPDVERTHTMIVLETPHEGRIPPEKLKV